MKVNEFLTEVDLNIGVTFNCKFYHGKKNASSKEVIDTFRSTPPFSTAKGIDKIDVTLHQLDGDFAHLKVSGNLQTLRPLSGALAQTVMPGGKIKLY